jgi:arylformamidase
MGAINYEVEYNNRDRVPEHPVIFERWKLDAADYRAQASANGRAEIGLKYGSSARQTLDLFFPDGGAQAPLSLFIHGGYWRSLEPALFSQTAIGLNAHGVTVAVAGYDLCPNVSIATIIDQMRQACLYLWRRFGKRMLAIGHSAGGHLAAAMLATDWKALDANAPPDLVPAAYAISGVYDLTPLCNVSMNQDLRLTPDDARASSPVFWKAPKGLTLDSVVGALESSEFLRQSRLIADEWGKAGVATRYEAISGDNHFTVIDALTHPDSAMVTRTTALAQHTAKSAG